MYNFNLDINNHNVNIDINTKHGTKTIKCVINAYLVDQYNTLTKNMCNKLNLKDNNLVLDLELQDMEHKLAKAFVVEGWEWMETLDTPEKNLLVDYICNTVLTKELETFKKKNM